LSSSNHKFMYMWNLQNKFQLNVQKCKELLFQFHRNRVPFDNIHLLAVRQAKILGVTVSDDLRWSTHVLNIIKKANKRIFLIIFLPPLRSRRELETIRKNRRIQAEPTHPCHTLLPDPRSFNF
jgi:hypothetical protein